MSTLLAVQIAQGQPRAGKSAPEARTTEQHGAGDPAGNIHSQPIDDHAFATGGGLSMESQPTTAIKRALFEWRLGQTQPLPLGSVGNVQSASLLSMLAPPVEVATPDWLSPVAFIFEASEALHQATSFESPGVLVEVDPLNLQCKFTFDLDQIDRLDQAITRE